MSCYEEDDLYEIRDIEKKKLCRLYVDNEWIESYNTEEEALRALDDWIDDYGMEDSGGCPEYVFDEAFVCKIIKTKVVRKIK